ncbi:MAG TPA: YfhO family protein, partial [Thermoanaerobaculia bacterium]|nr:YfhO family protein [Thermoanaerobaculia bacterium]
FRIVAQHWGFIPGTSTLYGLEDVRGYEALTLARFKMTFPLWSVEQPVWFNRVDDLTKPFLSFLNVRYAITTADPPPGWHTVATQWRSRLVENERVVPRAFVPATTTVGSAETINRTLDEMQRATDFRQHAWIDAPMRRHEELNGPGTVTEIKPRGPNGFRIRVTMERAGRVVVSEPGWNGWRAYVDGRRVEMQIANVAFLAIYVPAGAHTIRLIYLPQSFVIGRAISIATLAVLIALAVLQRVQFLLQRRNRRVAPLPDGQ